MSGSFMELECKGKKAFFVHQADRFSGATEFKKIADEGDIIYPYQYEGKDNFKNKATQIDSELLKFYFNNYCASSASG